MAKPIEVLRTELDKIKDPKLLRELIFMLSSFFIDDVKGLSDRMTDLKKVVDDPAASSQLKAQAHVVSIVLTLALSSRIAMSKDEKKRDISKG